MLPSAQLMSISRTLWRVADSGAAVWAAAGTGVPLTAAAGGGLVEVVSAVEEDGDFGAAVAAGSGMAGAV